MKFKAKKAFLHDQLGPVAKGAEFSADATQVAPVMQFVEKVQAAEAKDKAKDRK